MLNAIKLLGVRFKNIEVVRSAEIDTQNKINNKEMDIKKPINKRLGRKPVLLCTLEEELVSYCLLMKPKFFGLTHHVIRHNMTTHNVPSTAPQLSISQKALRTLPKCGNVMPKHVGATMYN
jgi:hypothetical protein